MLRSLLDKYQHNQALVKSMALDNVMFYGEINYNKLDKAISDDIIINDKFDKSFNYTANETKYQHKFRHNSDDQIIF